MHNGHGSTSKSYSRSYNPGAGGVVTHTTPTKQTTTTTGGGDAPHLRRKTTFTPKTKRTITPKDSKPSSFNLQNYLTQSLTGKHFGATGNRQKLINAMKLGLIDERQYKLMSGYDARKEMGMTPIQTLQASGIYNTAKGVMSPQDFKGQIGPIESTFLNTIGSTGYGFDKDQYSGILGLSPESLSKNPYGSGLGLDSQSLQQLGMASAYDFANGGLAYLLYGGLV